MRGLVFTELIEFVEEALGHNVSDKMIKEAKLDNNGVFTQGGSYEFDDLVKLVVSLSNITGKEVGELLYVFGEHMFERLVLLYGKEIDSKGSSIEFIDNVENVIHVEVRKLYPDAELPIFQTIEKGKDHLVIIYISNKRLEEFAHGLIDGCAKYFGELLDITYKTVDEDSHKVKFIIEKI